MRDRRKELRPATRLQVLSVAGGLTSLDARNVEAALLALYDEQPVRWQAFMDEAVLLIDAASADRSGFADTASPDTV